MEAVFLYWLLVDAMGLPVALLFVALGRPCPLYISSR